MALILFQHADEAQHAFSSDTKPTLHRALPAIEKLHGSWSERANDTNYIQFWPALEAGKEKLNEYYLKTAASDSHIIAMG